MWQCLQSSGRIPFRRGICTDHVITKNSNQEKDFVILVKKNLFKLEYVNFKTNKLKIESKNLFLHTNRNPA